MKLLGEILLAGFVGAMLLAAAWGGLSMMQDVNRAAKKINETPAQPPGCCLETRDDRFIRVVGSQCNEWRLVIPGCP